MRLISSRSGYFKYHASYRIKIRVTTWVDAICYNQEDPAEAEEQLLFQGHIYRLAARTIIWLGVSLMDPTTHEWWIDMAYPTWTRGRFDQDKVAYQSSLTHELINPRYWVQSLGLMPPAYLCI